MFGANRKKFMEGGVESDFTDDSSLYYSQQSMFPPHRNDKDVSWWSKCSDPPLLLSPRKQQNFSLEQFITRTNKSSDTNLF